MSCSQAARPCEQEAEIMTEAAVAGEGSEQRTRLQARVSTDELKEFQLGPAGMARTEADRYAFEHTRSTAA